MQIGRLILLALTLGGVAAGQTCDTCHDQAKKLPHTAHAAITCDTCHPGRARFPHPPGATSLTCETCHEREASQTALGVHERARRQGNEAAPTCATCHSNAHETALPGSTPYRKNLLDTCGMCHDEIARQFKESVHGRAIEKGIREAPVCTDCHGEHAILPHTSPISPTHVSRLRETCAHCHDNVQLTSKFGLPADRIVSYEASFHGLAARAGAQTVANCGSCHGIHEILPSSDLRSSISQANLPGTCGRCHPGAGRRFALGPVHVVEGKAEAPSVRVVRIIYLVLIPVTIGFMALHNIGDWMRKLRQRLRGEWPPRPYGPGELRMYVAERVQHALLAVSFMVLAWTGFALKYPEAFWARPLVAWESSWPVRGTVHRVAAGVFLATAVLHLISLAASAQLRGHWMTLRPRYSDAREGLAALAYNLGLRRQEPAVSPHSYIEKAEYWAVVWGAVIMSITGIMLWANTFFLARMPKTAMDVATAIHFYEAVLATLAIVVWHFYFVIFDPDVYPMDTAWLRGVSSRMRKRQNELSLHSLPTEHPAERPKLKAVQDS